MESTLKKNRLFDNINTQNKESAVSGTDLRENDKMTLLEADIQQEYIIKEINTDDEEMNAFLFRLGCYSGEPITIVSKKKKSCIVVIKDGRYNLDNLLAEAIIV